MGRKDSEGYKRYKKRRNKILLKNTLKFAPFVLILGIGEYFVVKSFTGEIVGEFNYKDYKEYVVDNSDNEIEAPEIEEIESISENTTDDYEEPVEVTEKEEVEETENEQSEDIEETIEEPVEIINTDLLDMGYDFQSIDFEGLKAKNDDVIGWIEISNTNVNHPIVQAEDNEYYEHKDIDGDYSKSGSIYLDYRSSSFENPEYDLSDVSLIYGHHMSGGRMFADICKYKSQEFYEANPFFVIYTSDGYAYKADVFAGVLYAGKSEENLYHIDYDSNKLYKVYQNEDEFKILTADECFNEYMNYLYDNSVISSDMKLEFGDKIVGLVTCSYENGLNGDLRFVVFAKLSKQYTNELQINNDNNAMLTLR